MHVHPGKVNIHMPGGKGMVVWKVCGGYVCQGGVMGQGGGEKGVCGVCVATAWDAGRTKVGGGIKCLVDGSKV